MKAAFVLNAFSDNKSNNYKTQRMSEEFALFGISSKVLKNDGTLATIDKNGNIKLNFDADFVVYFDKDKYLPRMLEKCGMRVFNNATANELCDDKMATHIALANSGIKMPKTVGGALCFSKEVQVSKGYAKNIADLLGFPLVAKLCHGSFGEQVFKIESLSQLELWILQNKTSAYLFQKFENSGNFDIRVIVIGGKSVAAMKRVAAKGDFRSNVERGATAQSFALTEDISAIAEKSAQVLGLDFCGVDLLCTNDGIKVCEVNSNAMFTAMESVSGKNIARAYCEHIKKTINK